MLYSKNQKKQDNLYKICYIIVINKNTNSELVKH